MSKELSPVICNNCALLLIRRCYIKHWWFRLIREPLICGMHILAWWNGINARHYAKNIPECCGCVRFMKANLEEKSAAFIFLNKYIGPRFKALRDSMLTQEDFEEAKRYAREIWKEK
jgi:hypothetical protein